MLLVTQFAERIMLLLCDAARTVCTHTAGRRVCARARLVCLCARSVIKASAQTDKHSFRPPLITRRVIYHAHVYNARVKTNLYGRVELFTALLSRRSRN